MTDTKDADKLREKYYHSMGAALTGEGNLEEAVVFFQKAIDICDTPYAWYGLARALRDAGDAAGAVGAMTRAIKLAPDTPEYYHERAVLLEALGRPDLAGDDAKRAVAIDRNYERIDTIRWAARVVGEVFTGPAVTREFEGVQVRGEELGRILAFMEQKGRRLSEVFHKPSCPVSSCPAYCCHFAGKLLLHGVTVGPWKLQGLRAYLSEKGLPEEDFLETFPVEQARYSESLFSPQDIMKRSGVPSVTFPRQKDCPLGGELARDIPKGQDYRTLMWISARARPCIFLAGGRCSIYDVGGDPSLDSCASFLCMTGFIFVALKHLGFLDEEALKAKTMAELNDIAVEAMVILARDVYGSDEAASSAEAVAHELKTAIEEDRSGNEALRDAAVERYTLLKVRHDGLTEELLAAAGQEIARLFFDKQN